MSIQCNYFREDATSTTETSVTIIDGNGEKHTATKQGATNMVLKHNTTSITFGGTNIAGVTITTDDTLVNTSSILTSGKDISLTAGSSTIWYIV
jgi:hypothetical protein